MDAVAAESHARAAVLLRRAIAALDRVDDARALGIAPQGRLERAAIAAENRIEAFLRQGRTASECGETLDELQRIAELLEDVDESVRNSVTLR